ncbi:MAG: winged helix-turn-helix transcriptional regulator [Actinomycetota bacterium]|nr:winged helix-turn-helix transcriptional regulator [Actinomycetota bacterium]
MLPNDENAFLKETEALHNLRVLEEIEKNPKISQRELSSHLGVALGITNALLKTLVHKGLIKIRGENNRSLTYHLTHAGILQKSALAMRWTLNTVDFYRQARRDVAERMEAIADEGIRSIVLYGISEFTEIAVIVSYEVSLEVKGLIDGNGSGRKSILGLPIGSDDLIDKIKPDALVVCVAPDAAIFEKLAVYKDSGIKVYRLV